MYFFQENNWQLIGATEHSTDPFFTLIANGTLMTSQCSLPCSTCYKSVWSSARLWLMRAAETLQGRRGSLTGAHTEIRCSAEHHMELPLVRGSWQTFRRQGRSSANKQQAWDDPLLAVTLHVHNKKTRSPKAPLLARGWGNITKFFEDGGRHVKTSFYIFAKTCQSPWVAGQERTPLPLTSFVDIE